jgi:hypothetical protein
MLNTERQISHLNYRQGTKSTKITHFTILKLALKGLAVKFASLLRKKEQVNRREVLLIHCSEVTSIS